MSSFSFFSSSCCWSTSSSSGSLFPLLDQIQPITDEEFNKFHALDRELFSHLIFNLGREARESMLVMAFWLWLQREDGYRPLKLTEKILRTLPPPVVSQVANETVICLRCLQNEHFMFSGSDEEILNLQNLMELKRLGLQELHENRVEILAKVMKIADEVCARAFKDIIEGTFGASIVFNSSNEGSGNRTSNRFGTLTPPVMAVPSYPSVVPQLGFSEVPQFVGGEVGVQGNGMGLHHFVPDEGVVHDLNGMGLQNFVPNNVHRLALTGVPNYAVAPNYAVVPSGMGFGGSVNDRNFNVFYELQNQEAQHREIVNRDLELMMNRFHISEPPQTEVAPEDRSLFVTFSKGYPLSENEVRNFFTRTFGDFIEAIYMQEVDDPETDQVLHARIVARTLSDIYRVVKPNESKVKFSVNGKHLWARKFVRNNAPRTTGRGGPMR